MRAPRPLESGHAWEFGGITARAVRRRAELEALLRAADAPANPLDTPPVARS